MTPFDPDPEAVDLVAPEPPDDEQFPARRLLAHDVDDSWLDDDLPDGWRPID
ncbi:MAG TPA: hypothetical protein VN213_07420 [Solirubrobacteraceae bacterium]|nr:hypothetical protein [Solirubrobacteraceae bacterium]